jgi:hypothetical protein
MFGNRIPTHANFRKPTVALSKDNTKFIDEIESGDILNLDVIGEVVGSRLEMNEDGSEYMHFDILIKNSKIIQIREARR